MNLTFPKSLPRINIRVSTSPLFLLVCLSVVSARGPKLNPVQWSLSAAPEPVSSGSTIVLQLHADIAPGYHLYSLTTPKGGPIRTTLSLKDGSSFDNVRVYQPSPDRHNDPNLNVPVETFSGPTDFPMQVKIKQGAASGAATLVAQTRYQACSDEICLPPVERTATATITIEKDAPVTKASVPGAYQLVNGPPTAAARPIAVSGMRMPLNFRFLLLAFGFGLVAIFTPCVFPMVPLTVSYFLNQQGNNRGAAVRQALLFSAGIVVLFSVIGVLVTLLAGPFGVVQLASSPWVNGVIAMVFFALGLSLLGAFELTLPSGLLTRLDGASQKGGVLGGLLLGLTFCLTSFACVGPFLGTLLAASVQSSGWQPIFGMVAFATGLAAPFFLLSLFPAFLNRLPRSGAWLSRVKIVFGFMILAIALKYLASVDQVLQFHFLTRERFVALWFALFLMAALYLWGQLKLLHAGEKPEIGLGRLLSGAALLAFAVSLLPALWGSKLGELESFLPAADTQTFTITNASGQTANLVWLKDDYPQALAQAQREHKPLLVSFSGYACTNCHWMKANIFPRPEISAALGNFVLVELYTDGTDAVSSKNQMLEQDRFSTVALPYYVILDEKEKEITHQAGLTRDPQQFLSFLNTGRNSASDAQAQTAAL